MQLKRESQYLLGSLQKLKPMGRICIGEDHGGLSLLEGTPSMLEQGKEVRSPPLEEEGVTISMN